MLPSARKRGNNHTLEYRRFYLKIMKDFCGRAHVAQRGCAVLLGHFQSCLDVVLGNLIWVVLSEGGLEQKTSRSPPHPQQFYNSVIRKYPLRLLGFPLTYRKTSTLVSGPNQSILASEAGRLALKICQAECRLPRVLRIYSSLSICLSTCLHRCHRLCFSGCCLTFSYARLGGLQHPKRAREILLSAAGL